MYIKDGISYDADMFKHLNISDRNLEIQRIWKECKENNYSKLLYTTKLFMFIPSA